MKADSVQKDKDLTNRVSKKNYSSVKWNAINSLFGQSVTIILGVLLMNLLSPRDFGLLGMIMVFSGFLNIIKDGGLGSSLIYKKKLTHLDLNTVFWLNLVLGICLSLIFFLVSQPLAAYYGDFQLIKIIKVFSFIFLISSTNLINETLLTKSLQFKKKFVIEALSISISGVAALFLAYKNYGVWSLVFMHLLRALCRTIILWIFTSFRPRLEFSFDILKNHFRYTIPVFGTKSFNYWTRNADNLLIGKFLGSQELGYYSRSYFFVTFPVQRFTNILGSVLFPVMSQDNYTKKEIKSLLLRAMKLTSLITFPLIGLFIVVSEPFVVVLFGEKWLPMLPSLRILSFVAMIESVLVLTTPVFYALGATKLNFKITISFGLLNFLFFYIGSQFSIEIVAALLLMSTIIFVLPRCYYIIKLTGATAGDMASSVSLVFVINLVAMVLSMAVAYWLIGMPPWLILLLCSLVHFGSYMLLNMLLNKNNLEELRISIFKILA